MSQNANVEVSNDDELCKLKAYLAKLQSFSQIEHNDAGSTCDKCELVDDICKVQSKIALLTDKNKVGQIK